MQLLNQYVKGILFVNEGYAKRLSCLSKVVYKRVRGWTSGRSLSRTKFR